MKRAIIIFTRIPLPGKTKTRMMPALSGRKCAALHICFLKDIYAACRKADTDIFVDYMPEDADQVNILKDIFGEEVYCFIQEGGTLGERMYQGIRYVLEQGYQSCVLVGTDIPEIRSEQIRRAFEVPEEREIVFGRTLDGGYYLVGMKRPWKEAFGLERYGVSTVFEETLRQLEEKGISVGYTGSLQDMDTPEYLLKPVEDSDYTCDTPAVVTFVTDEEWNNYVATVNGEAYTGEEITIVVKDSSAEEPDPEPEPTPELPYRDVTDADWFYNEVAYAYEKGIMTGINDTTFAPYDSLARAQFAIILHRLNGEPQMEYTDRFHDVGEGLWYTDAILWAEDIDVVTGYSNGNFGPADKINREQMATMMYRYAEYKGYSLEGGVDYSQYKDAANVSDFAKEAMSWAVGNGVITGKYDETRLDPQGEASRAECAIIMMRFMETFGE